MPRPVSPYIVREARRSDGAAWLRLIGELAAFERLQPPTSAAGRRLLRDAFGPRPKIKVLLATHGDDVVAYSILTWTYSSFLARPTLWLEDIYITDAHRGRGLSDLLLAKIARYARTQKAGRIEGIVLDWNRHAQNFYHRTGAELKREWILLRYDEAAIDRLATSGVRARRGKTIKPDPRLRSIRRRSTR